MATRSYIAIKVDEKDINTIKQYEKPSTLSYPQSQCGWIVKNNENIDFPAVKIEGQYIAIYHHWDGYPSALGATLLKKYNSYNEVLNLILGGAISTLMVGDNEIPRYYALRDEETWDYIKPISVNSTDDIPQEDYTYLFENGQWYFNSYKDKEFAPLTEEICKDN